MYQKPMSSSALLLGRTFLFVVFSQLLLACASAQMISPVKKEEAKISVAIVDDVKNADLKVFRTDPQHKDLNRNSGFWSITEGTPTGAIKIYWTNDSTTADLKIRLVMDPADAGWINKAKKKLLKQ
ncbi:DUF6150 family protein [Sediminibacterium ginsengisoli]|uniref:7(1) septoil knot domain-containing protein n=1 Tax=Sediminibacterium ginsengisoli TaxID=413434 RepID=A0A1T4RTG6_9BACT|nr:DUF6150 family protein [Sediminibacterium ginsengisoli]SKA19048.1 hypothetical protein SAMN04488132_11458 [Sediminibacterium ginsengisoli]